MNIDLISIYEKNKKIDKIREDINEQFTINDLIIALLNGNEDFNLPDNKLFDKIGFKYTKKTRKTVFGKYVSYNVKLNKANIKLLQNYINKQEVVNE